MKRRVHVYYAGRVQGVGFRVTAGEIAQEHGIAGWVKNLKDGRVELVGEGDEDKLEVFLEAIQYGAMKNFIKGIELTWGNATNTFTEFEIRYY